MRDFPSMAGWKYFIACYVTLKYSENSFPCLRPAHSRSASAICCRIDNVHYFFTVPLSRPFYREVLGYFHFPCQNKSQVLCMHDIKACNDFQTLLNYEPVSGQQCLKCVPFAVWLSGPPSPLQHQGDAAQDPVQTTCMANTRYVMK